MVEAAKIDASSTGSTTSTPRREADRGGQLRDSDGDLRTTTPSSTWRCASPCRRSTTSTCGAPSRTSSIVAAYLRACCVASVAAGHVIVNSTLDGLLVDYDPYASKGAAGDVRRARAEMAQSRYDANGDGRCDATVCRNVVLIQHVGFEIAVPELRKIGIRTAGQGARPREVPAGR